MLSKTALHAKEIALIQSKGLYGFNRAMCIFNTLKHHPYCTYTKKNFNKDIAENHYDSFYSLDDTVLNNMLKNIR